MALANGIEPGKLKFKQDAMRNHLYRCFNKGELRMFPATRRDVQATVRSTDFIEQFCSCRMPEMSPMVECSQCRQWYHTDCVNVPKIALDETDVDWFCYNCSQ